MNKKIIMNSKEYKYRGITLISLVITIIVLIILASVAIYLSLGNNGMFTRAKEAKEVTNKQEATEKINLKITTAQMNKYAEKQKMPTLQELADVLYEDNEIEYVALESKVADKEKIEIGDSTSIYTKLNKYPYEFEINNMLQLASINGVKLANTNNSDWTLIGKLTGKGDENNNYIDLTNINYKEIYVYAETYGEYVYSSNILKERLSDDLKYLQLGMDHNYRVGIVMNNKKTWIYGAWTDGNDVSNTATVYYYYK